MRDVSRLRSISGILSKQKKFVDRVDVGSFVR